MRDAEAARKPAFWFYVLAVVVLAADQVTKLIARAALEPSRARTVVPGFFDLKLSYNTGAAFGMLPDWAPFFMIAAVVAVFAIVRLRSVGAGSRCLSVGLGLLLGGALSNLADRLTSPEHAVTDFLSFHVGRYWWPAFNLADAGIVIGAMLTIFYVYVVKKRSTEGNEGSDGLMA